VLQFVWCYFHRAAAQDELRFSMRSIEKNFQGEVEFLVIGDRPPWYDGPFIDCPRIRKGGGFRRGLHDVLNKMSVLSEHEDVRDEFVWMMDDVFMVRPTTYRQMITPRAAGNIGIKKYNGWQTVKTNTGKRLRENGLPFRDYATHLPHHVHKSKLQELFQEWDPLTETFLWEVAYNNFHKHVPAKHDPFLRRIKKEKTPEWYDGISEKSHFLNIYARGWGGDLRGWLFDRFPDRHKGEIGQIHRYKRLDQIPEVDDYFLIIQSAYNDEELSRNRLRMTERWLIPSLRGQTQKVKVRVSVCEDDPILEERMEAFRSCGHEVSFVYRDRSEVPLHVDNIHGVEDWGIPSGIRTVVSRIDDDDAIPIDFFELTLKRATECPWDSAVLEWTNGYVWINGTLYRSFRKGNQFCTVVSMTGMQPHQDLHWKLSSTLPVMRVNQSRGWCWVRHEDTIVEVRDIHIGKKASPPNKSRWAVDFKGA